MKSQLYKKNHKIMYERVLRYIQYIMKLEHQLLIIKTCLFTSTSKYAG